MIILHFAEVFEVKGEITSEITTRGTQIVIINN